MTFSFNLHSSLLLPFAVQGGIAGAALWWRGRRDDVLADRLLAVWLLLLTLSVLQWLLGYAGWYDSHDAATTLMFYVPWNNALAFGPLVYVYFRALTDQSFRLTRAEVRHFGPALAVAALYPATWLVDVGWHHLVQHEALPYHYGTQGRLAAGLQMLSGWWVPLEYLSLVWYSVQTLRVFRAYQYYLDAHFSDTAQLRFQWVWRALVATLIIVAVWLGFSIYEWVVGGLGFDQWWLAYLGSGLLIYYLSFAGLQAGSGGHPALLFRAGAPGGGAMVAEAAVVSPWPAGPTVEEALPTAEQPVAAAPALPPDVAEYLPGVLTLMTADQPWREPELTLADLAHRLRLAPALLSRVINAGTGQHFNDFVNAYRVAEAARRLRDPAFRHYTLLAVALEAGFNSKSTFNRVFKKMNGLTPSEFAAVTNGGEGADS